MYVEEGGTDIYDVCVTAFPLVTALLEPNYKAFVDQLTNLSRTGSNLVIKSKWISASSHPVLIYPCLSYFFLQKFLEATIDSLVGEEGEETVEIPQF